MSIASEASESIEVVEPELPAYARTAGDVVRVVGSSAALLAALLVAAIFRASINGAETDVVKLAGTVPGPLTQVLRFASGYFGFIGAVALIVALVIIQRLRVAVMVTAAAAAGAIAMFAISKALASDVALPGDLGQLRGVAYIGSQFLAGATAVLTVISPWIERPWRRAGAILIALTAFTRITTVLQTATSESPYDVAVAILLGWLVGALILLIFCSPNRRPSGLHIGESLRRSGLDVVKLEHAGVGVRGSTIYRALERDGTARFVKVFSADQPDADRLVQAWRWFRLRDAALEQPFASLRRSVEHEAFLSLYAFDGNIPTARLATIAEVEPGGMLLAFDYVDGNSLQGNGPDHLTDPILRGIWQEVARLHSLNVAHRDLRLAHVLLDPEGAPVLVDFGYAEVAASDLQIRTDVAELLCSTAVEVGAERAVAAAIDVLGSDAIGRALPRLQPLALRPATRKAMAACDGLLGELQEQVQTATGIEDVKYEELARVSPKTVVGFAVFAIALYALLPRLAEVSDIGATLATAVWVWIIPLLMFQSVTYVGAGLGIEGSVPDRVAFFPTMKAQVAAAFVDVLAPASIGGMALNTRFLQKRGVDPGVAVAGVGLNVVAGVVAHVLLLAGFILWVGTGSTSDSATVGDVSSVAIIALWVLLALAVVVGIGLAIPAGRRLVQRKVLPLVHEARVGIVELARQPRKLVALLGGSAVVTLGFLGALVCAVRAFGGTVPIPELGVAYLLASTVAIVAPTPGGLGAIEAALIAALTRLGMSADAAVSAVFLFRTGTFWAPVLPGWITFHQMQRRGDI